jgi:non-ribosomal peptide synthetase component F
MSVIDGIERAVRDFPDADALQTSDHTISYRELGELSDEFASQVKTQTAPGEFVAIAGSRGLTAVVAMTGALKAGRPFVVIDARDSPSSNQEKVRLLGVRLLARPAGDGGPGDGRDDGQVALTKVPAQWRSGQAGSGRASREVGQSAGDDLPDAFPCADFAAGEIGYAIYTSGSTGKPKCVLVRTDALAPVIADHVERLSVGPGSATLQFARLTFDGCITEIFWTLTAGARLVVLDETHLAPGPVLRSTLERFRITHLKTTPFALTATEPSGAMSLEHVINGGGACRYPVLRKWSAVARVHNAYGLTETTVCNLLSDALDPDACRESVPLGERVGDCDYYIADIGDAGDAGSLSDAGGGGDAAGMGVTASTADRFARRGELVITGTSVAAGYLTADGVQPFGLADPAGGCGTGGYATAAHGTAAYRTGDIVELRDGQLHFVERLDRQLKVRGYRIDPGEIENAVCRLGSVSDAVVAAEAYDAAAPDAAAAPADADAAERDALVCYYLGDADPRALRQQLEAVLDPYKVPSVLERVETFPYTPNGKVDRDALQASRRALATRLEPARLEPESPEQQVLDLVRGLTGVVDVALEDNFFDLGGDSASAVVLVTKLRALGWVDAGVRDVLRAEDLAVLAARLREWSV